MIKSMASPVETTPVGSPTSTNDHDDLEFEWGTKRGTGGKRKAIQFYESFTFDGLEYALYDCVYMHKGGEPEPYIAKLIKIWEHVDKSKKIKVLWFFRPSEIQYYLKDEKFMDNEIFLASGEGIGATNVNPVEAIAGKCNVVCISEDSRNRQPSKEELEAADYVFYRVFDVGRCTLDMIGDRVGDLEVKFVFNRNESEKASDDKLPSDQKDDKHATVLLNRQDSASVMKIETGDGNSSSLVLKKNEPEIMHEDGNVLSAELGSKTAPKSISLESKEDSKMMTKIFMPENTSVDKTSCIEVKDKKDNGKHDNNTKSDVNVVGVGGNSTHIKDFGTLDNMDLKRVKHDSTKLLERKDSNNTKRLSRDDTNPRVEGVSTSTHDEDKKFSIKDPSGLGKDAKSGKDSIHKVDKPSMKAKIDIKDPSGLGKDAKTRKDPTLEVDRISKKAKIDISTRISEDTNRSNAHKPNDCSRENEDKALPKAVNSFEDKMSKPSKSSGELDKDTKVSSKANDFFKERAIIPKTTLGLNKSLGKAQSSMKPNKLSNRNVPSFIDASTKEIEEIEGKSFEVTPRRVADPVTWYKELSWEERMQTANDKGTLLLLQNLDPGFTSAEVQDIIWHAFKEKCSAKMIQRTAFSSPNYGRALAIFKTREAAEGIIKKLRNRYLMVSNQRPIVADIIALPKPQKSTSFVGHLFIDRVRHQMQREMKEAVSTSHCSQPNTIEYEMAMEWCLLQSQSEYWWKRLYKQQREEMKKIIGNLKSK